MADKNPPSCPLVLLRYQPHHLPPYHLKEGGINQHRLLASTSASLESLNTNWHKTLSAQPHLHYKGPLIPAGLGLSLVSPSTFNFIRHSDREGNRSVIFCALSLDSPCTHPIASDIVNFQIPEFLHYHNPFANPLPLYNALHGSSD